MKRILVAVMIIGALAVGCGDDGGKMRGGYVDNTRTEEKGG